MAHDRAAIWWVDRWRKSTAYTDMTLEQQGAYRNLIDELWLRGGVLPDDDRILGKVAGDARRWPKLRDVVMARFVKTPEGWRNATHDKVKAQNEAYFDGKVRGGRARASKAKRGGRGRFGAGESVGDRAGGSAGGAAGEFHQPPNPNPGDSSEGIPHGTRARGAPGGALGAVPGVETAPALRIGPPRGMRWSSREGGFVIVDQAEFDAAKAEAATRGETFP